MSSQVRQPGEAPAGKVMEEVMDDGSGAAARDASGRVAPGRAKGNPRVPEPGEWETSSPPPSVLYFRALLLRKPEPPAGPDRTGG